MNDENYFASYALIGRNPFFRQFDITFIENKGRLILRTPKG